MGDIQRVNQKGRVRNGPVFEPYGSGKWKWEFQKFPILSLQRDNLFLLEVLFWLAVMIILHQVMS